MRLRRWLVPVLMTALALTACTSGNGDDPEERTPLVHQAINAKPREEMSEGGELRIAVASLPQTFNPLHTRSSIPGTHTLPYLPSFFSYDQAGVATPNPDYVESAEASGSPTVATITLNPKAVWGDGSPLTWQDIAATVQACKGASPGFQCAENRFAAVEKVERGANDQQAVVTFTGVQPEWEHVFRGVSTLRASSVSSAEQFNNGWAEPKPEWLSGPFTFDRYDRENKRLTWVPSDKWWGKAPLLQRLTYKQIAPDATAAAYLNNDVDTFIIGIDPDGQRRAQGAADGDVRTAASGDTRQLVFNTRSGPLADVKVRQAIVAALDRDQIARTDLEGIEWTPRALNSHVWVENHPDFEDVADKTGLKYDPDRAREILDEAGWVGGEDGIRAKDGNRLTLTFTTIKGLKASESEGQQIQKMLADVGIEVKFTEVELNQYSTEELMTSGKFQMLAVTETGHPSPLLSISRRYTPDTPSNWSGWTSEEFTAVSTELATEADPDKRVELGRKADALLWEAAPAVPLYQLPESVATKRNLANYGAFGLGTPVWPEVGFTDDR
ncbi:ABC transporter family substrate-binding protein [Enemella sp. A6]|uniref:ABC transporter family substrate-binding protein n=1 Tax=Enemella sp. A6 TaxID=3440152 RepID=UPI003EBDD840